MRSDVVIREYFTPGYALNGSYVPASGYSAIESADSPENNCGYDEVATFTIEEWREYYSDPDHVDGVAENAPQDIQRRHAEWYGKKGRAESSPTLSYLLGENNN